MIPRIIHQIWYQGTDKVPPRYRRNMAKLQALNPHWQHILWDDAGLRALCQDCGLLPVYDDFRYLHQKVDFARYLLLYRFGGISVDMDVVSLQPLDNTPGGSTAALIVSETPLNRVETFCYSLGQFGKLFNNAMILAAPESKHLLHLIHTIVNSNSSGLLGKMYEIQWSTGPFIFTRSLQESFRMLGRHNVHVLPAHFFEPCYSQDPHCTPQATSILDHQHATSWVNSDLITISKTYYGLKPMIVPAFIVVMYIVMYRA